jgi:hypothetical protein
MKEFYDYSIRTGYEERLKNLQIMKQKEIQEWTDTFNTNQ